MKRNCLILLIVSLVILCGCGQLPAGMPSPKSSRGDVKILTHSGIKYGGGPTVRISGEVQNIGTSNLEYVKLDATFYDSENKVIQRDPEWNWHHTVWMDVLLPGEKAPFWFIIIGLTKEYKSYRLSVAEVRQTTKQPYRDFEWLDQSSFIGERDWYRVKGSIKNTGTQDVHHLNILVTFYDAQGKVVWVDLVGPPTQLKEGLGAGKTASFEAQAISHISSKIKSYSLKTNAIP